MYYDYNNFDQTYFEGNDVTNPNPAGYSDYGDDALPFDWHAEKLKQEFEDHGIDPTGKKVLVVGCAYGYTVKYLMDEWDIDAYGMDISTWTMNNTPFGYGNRFYQGDARSKQDVKSVVNDIGNLDAIFTECVLSCFTDTEAQNVADNLRQVTGTLIHRVWSRYGSEVNGTYYNSKTMADWKSLCDPDGADYWYTEDDW